MLGCLPVYNMQLGSIFTIAIQWSIKGYEYKNPTQHNIIYKVLKGMYIIQ